MKAEIIAVGSELLTPDFQDTNSLYLTAGLDTLGIAVAFKTIVGDEEDIDGPGQAAKGQHPARGRDGAGRRARRQGHEPEAEELGQEGRGGPVHANLPARS